MKEASRVKRIVKITALLLFALVLLSGIFINHTIAQMEAQSGFLFYFRGKTKFDIAVFFYLLTAGLFFASFYLLIRKRTHKLAFSLVFVAAFTVGIYLLGVKGFLGDYYSYFTFPSPLKTNELILVDKSFLHDSDYSLYVRQSKYFLKEIDNAPLYELTAEFHWDKRMYALNWVNETTVEIVRTKPNADAVKDRVQFAVK